MTQPKHTPGPWFVRELRNATGCRDIGPKRGELRKKVDPLAFTTGLDNDEEDKANAHLIAAAPEMLAAGEKLVEWLDRLAEKSEQAAKTTRFESMREAFTFDAKNFRASAKEMREAIQKARGQQ